MSDCSHYYIIRVFKGDKKTRKVRTGLTLAEAQDHCGSVDSHSDTCTTSAGKRRTRVYGGWMDCYDH